MTFVDEDIDVERHAFRDICPQGETTYQHQWYRRKDALKIWNRLHCGSPIEKAAR
jgi:5-methylcytosine-specific restriction endonuclease McrA